MITRANFACRRCGQCCMTFTVKVTVEEIKRISKLGFKPSEFAVLDDFDEQYSPYALKRKDGQCVFLEKKEGSYGCKIYNSRPRICQDYPFNECNEIEDCKPEQGFLEFNKENYEKFINK